MDSGGSKTKLRLYDCSGGLIKEHTVQGFGLAEDSEAALSEAVAVLADFSVGYKIRTVICNLGGKNKRQIKATLGAAFPNAEICVFRESEGVVGLELCKKYAAEVTLMAGTGAIAIARSGEKAVICGGWGVNISDNGSGYQLGLDAVRLALEEIDGAGELSLLTKTLTGLSEPPKPMAAEEYCEFRDSVRRKLAPFDRAHIASFSKTVYACAKRGDERAIELYQKVGLELAKLVLAAARKAGRGLSSAVVNGGMVNAKEFWQESFEEKLKNEHKAVKIHYLTDGIDEVMCDMAKSIKSN